MGQVDGDGWMGVAMWRWEGSLKSKETHPRWRMDGGNGKNLHPLIASSRWRIEVDAVGAGQLAGCDVSAVC
jgi:hypothetical protein